jgi:hypothetical protein
MLLLPKKCYKCKNPYLVGSVSGSVLQWVRFGSGSLPRKISGFWFGSVLPFFQVLVRFVRDSSGSFHISIKGLIKAVFEIVAMVDGGYHICQHRARSIYYMPGARIILSSNFSS